MVGIYTLTIFVSASLLFVVQPMAGKMILPHLGGSSAVWTTCMLFFQSVLVAGYVYAHFLARHVAPKRQLFVHLAIMVLACVVSLPLGIPSSLIQSQSTPALWLLLALLAGIGLPLFIVSTSAPLFQRWFSYTDHRDAQDPYYLYAASNMGSMLALLGYPFVVEPLLGLDNQTLVWSGGFIGLVAMTGACGYFLWHRRMPEDLRESEPDETADIAWKRKAKWVFWAFLPSSLMLGVTQYMTTDIASVPLLWVLPLALYLLSFIFVFSKREIRLPAYFRTLIPVVVFGVLALSVSELWMSLLILAHLTMFFLIALFFHGRMAEDRPDASGLTEFYIWMSVGGALGGLFNALGAPLIFDRPLEYTTMLVVSVAAILPNSERIDDEFNPTWAVPTIMAPIALGYLWMLDFWSLTELWYLAAAIGAVAAATALAIRFPKLENVAAAALIFTGLQSFYILPGVLTYERSFFASYAVFEREHPTGTYRKLSHGTTSHGVQGIDEEMEETPVGYHHPDGPVGQVLDAVPHHRIAVVGLGAGAMAAYGGPDNHVVFYEIDPVIEKVAREYFTYLDDCGPYCTVEIGDGRKLLEKDEDNEYDVVFMDAYNSDSVPTHLLTKEAMQLYFSKVDEEGVVVFHVSNRYLDVEGVVGGLVEEMGYASRTQIHIPRRELQAKLVYTSAYTVVARNEEDLRELADSQKWRATDAADILWTDDYSNVATVFDWKY